jgi:hypothetical protein
VNQGFPKILHLVDHPHQFHLDQDARLTAARRWLEESGSVSWLLVVRNVNPSTLNFIQEHLPRKNKRGSILFTITTWTDAVAAVLAYSAGEQHKIVEPGLPEVQDAVDMLLKESNMDAVKRVGCLPLALSHAAHT